MIESLFPSDTRLFVDEIQVQTETIYIYARRRFKARWLDYQQIGDTCIWRHIRCTQKRSWWSSMNWNLTRSAWRSLYCVMLTAFLE